ncbi:helicase-associated domain-containing protein [Candidatus Sumerlaeota bacterium]|nr:helicase-associated domain-containing protein [Candidatus Sumerlaeota bacterium]
MKLKSILKSMELAQLQDIQKYWGVHEMIFSPGVPSAKQKLQLVEYLYPRLQISQYFMGAYNRLGMGEKDLMYFLAIHGGDMGESEILQRFFNGETERMEQAIGILTLKGMVFFDESGDKKIKERLAGIPEPFLRYITLPSYWEGYLGFYLNEMNAQSLKELVSKKLKVRTRSTRHNILVYLARQHLLTPKKLRQYIQSLGENEREIFRMILDRKGVCVYRDLLDSGYQKHYDHSKAEYVNNLTNNSGLVFVAQQGENKYNNLLMIPKDIYYIIDHHYAEDMRPLQELDTVKSQYKEHAPSNIIDNSNNMLRDIVIVASYINHNNVKPLATGGMGKNDLKKFVPFVSANKTLKYIGFLALFMIENKFLIPVGNSWRVNNTFHAWLDKGLECYQDIYQFWLTTNQWNEEHIDGNAHHSDAAANLINAPELRKLVLRNIQSIPHTRWINFDAFAESLAPQVEMNIPRRGGGMERNQRPVKMIIESVIAEMLHWLGIVTLGIDEKTNLARLGNRMRGSSRTRGNNHQFFFQVTPLGRFILDGPFDNPKKLFEGRDTSFLPLYNEVNLFTVQPNLEIITPPDLKLRSFFQLNEFAQIKSIDVMSTLVISRESLRNGMDRGMEAEEILNFLNECCPQGVPETVKHLIAECSDKHGELRMGFAGGFMRVLDRILLEELKSQKKLKPFIKDVLDDKLIILQPNLDVRKVARELQKLGFMPQLDSENVTVTSEGKYNISLSQEELYTLMAVLRFTGFVENLLESDITQNQIGPLLERLKPDSGKQYNLNYYAETVSHTYERRFEEALKKKMSSVMGKYKRQVGRLLTTHRAAKNAVAPRASRFGFQGANPAKRKNEILDMIEYSQENKQPIEIVYERRGGKATTLTVVPEEFNNEKMYAHVPERDRHINFFVARIQETRLAEEEN